MSIIFSNSISKPIINISKAALKLPQGQFDMPVKKNSFTEIHELTDTLSSASVEIAKADTLRKDLMVSIANAVGGTQHFEYDALGHVIAENQHEHNDEQDDAQDEI